MISEKTSQRCSEAQLVAHLSALPTGRHLVALAGPPASGKSTMANAIVEKLNANRDDRAAVIPMDGFHYDDQILEARGHRSRKGAPHTFDVGGLQHMLIRLKQRDEKEVAIPVFDRDIEIARAGAAIVSQQVDIVVVEGNYLLLNEEPWSCLHNMFDLTVSIHVAEAVLRKRLTKRWEGYQLNGDQIYAKLEENDLPNGRLVLENSIVADFTIDSSG